MPTGGPLDLDVVIFGGGGAGLWLLDDLVRGGYRVVLLESDQLGAGQTVASQGIIHGGLKYTLGGLLTPSARAVRDMPLVWRKCLAGETEPNLANTRVRAEFCHVWQTTSLSSRLAMMGVRHGLSIAPRPIATDALPEVLRGCPPPVARLDEQVIDPASLINDLADRHPDRLLRIDVRNGLEFNAGAPGDVSLVRLIDPHHGAPIDLRPRHVVLTAGAGNARLREQVGLSSAAMQRRPLHMVVARGPLPPISGHCVHGTATRVTITSQVDFADRVVWQIGGNVAETGARMDPPQLIAFARSELAAVLPALDQSDLEWSTYRVDRAEGATANWLRPDDVRILREGNTMTAWPTKLALVPRLVSRVRSMLDRPSPPGEPIEARLAEWTRPEVAEPPWETNDEWTRNV